jgi:hydrogenase nickel incorporation protein HypB
MCATCGCSGEHEHGDHEHGHAHDHAHGHDHEHEHRVIKMERDLLAKNDRIAAKNRGFLEGRGVFALNLVSGPGAGKTALLERAIGDLRGSPPIAVIEGDQATENDARRIRAAGARAIQINTGAACHLDASMVERALAELAPPRGTVVAIENVGNLVCPSLFDLGEGARAVVLSVTEGDDNPEKYPHMFRSADVMILNKMDLLPHVRFDVDACMRRARELSPHLRTFEVSATRGDGLEALYAWLRQRVEEVVA